MKTESEIRQALKDSEAYFKEKFKGMSPKNPVVRLNVKGGVEALAVANEICTLKWVLGNGVLNCYGGNK